ncbi:AMP-binding protein [Actinoplanes sp. NPDC049265]|uniref:non-ribosomal peptide synthetase n=1 Tax=Actinoplanes sp. NPDC049265 TaxID=3363902 RepID=UPI0037235C05
MSRSPSAQAGLLVESSPDFAVALFAAWRSGLGVLPLPVEFPDDRLRTMVRDAAPLVLLTSAVQRDRAERLTHGLVTRVVDVAAGPGTSPAPVAGPADHIAFTVYTSGSTGRPKGVAIRQSQVADLLAWETEAWRLGPWVRMAQTLSLGFDFGLQELFSSIPCGGCLVIPAAADRRNAVAYAGFLRRERVTVLFTTPSYADELAATRLPLPDLRLVLIGGEVLRWPTVAALEAIVGPDCRLINGYGPTEATVNCLAYEIPRRRPGRAGGSDIVPAGRASGPARIHLLDEYGLPAPAGAVGRISIGGPGVADGYLHRPDLTAERFVPGPPDSPQTVYRSGDLAYLDADGQFVVIGRDDRQVKLRGYRMEQGEIEWALRQTPGVVSAAVRVVGRPARLVALISGAVEVRDVLDDLARRLPGPLLPDHVLVLGQLPLTANGKLDDVAIQKLAESAGDQALPSTDLSTAEIEDVICRLWRDVLDLTVIDPARNVFDQGAHSLAATLAHSRLQAWLGLRFPVSDLFEYPCPRELAGRLREYRRTAGQPDAEPASGGRSTRSR